jgi:2-amino-4-hydroxy-6-hydroxymethyldihydropteridine diphosphokinase
MERIFLSLGSNLGDRRGHLRQALALIAQFATIIAVSDLYETEPVGYAEQPWFLNAAAEIRIDSARLNSDVASSQDAPHWLLDRLLATEHQLGRRREGAIPKGPRPIDLDILLFGQRVIQSPSLFLPHPAMHLRRFVLEPLAELAPEVLHPLERRTIGELLAALASNGETVRRLGPLDQG